MAASASAALAKYQRNTASAGQSYKDGIMAVKEAPGQRAVKAQEAMRRKWLEALDNGTWARRTGDVSLQSWQNAGTTKGVTNYQTGVTSPAAIGKMGAFLNAFVPVMEQASQAAKAIDKSTEAGALERVRLVMQAGKAFAASRR